MPSTFNHLYRDGDGYLSSSVVRQNGASIQSSVVSTPIATYSYNAAGELDSACGPKPNPDQPALAPDTAIQQRTAALSSIG